MLEDPNRLVIREKLACRTEIDGRVFSFDLKIEDITTAGILVYQPELAGQSLQIGQEVLVRYFRKDSAYQFLSRVERLDMRNDEILLCLRFPNRITRLQRRRFPRVRMEGTIRLLSTLQNAKPIHGFLMDISAGGVRGDLPRLGPFDATRPPVGHKFQIDITTESGEDLSGVLAEVRRALPHPTELTRILVQFGFISAPRKVQERINTLVEKAAPGTL